MPDAFLALFRAASSEALAGLVLDLTLKALLLLTLVLLAVSVLRRLTAATRHCILAFALGGLLCLPALSLVLPAWPVTWWPASTAMLSAWDEAASTVKGSSTAAARPARTSPEADARWTSPREGAGGPVGDVARERSGAGETQDVAIAEGSHHAPGDRLSPISWGGWVASLWLIGALLVLLRLLFGVIGLGWLVYHARPVEQIELRLSLEAACQQLGLKRSVRLLKSRRTVMPVTWGLFQPVILLPEEAGAWNEARRRYVLLHECAHIKRWDYLTQWLAQVACACYWFNPLVWIAARSMRIERELACDDRVLAASEDRASLYAAHLVDIARSLPARMLLASGAVAMAGPSHLEGRVRALLDPSRRRRPRPASRLVAGTALLVVVLPLAAMQTWVPKEGALVATRAGLLTNVEAEVPPATDANGPAMEERRWRFSLETGQTLQIQGIEGRIEVQPSLCRTAEVVAHITRVAGAVVGVSVEQQAAGVAFRTEIAPSTSNCSEIVSGGAVDYTVYLPPDTRFEGRVTDGDIRVQDVEADVQAHTVNGDVWVETAGWAEASAVNGSVRVQMGRADWTGTLTQRTVNGDLYVSLPAEAEAVLQARIHGTGKLCAPGACRNRTAGPHAWTTELGGSGRTLQLETVQGQICIEVQTDPEPQTTEEAASVLAEEGVSVEKVEVNRVEPMPSAFGVPSASEQAPRGKRRTRRGVDADADFADALKRLGFTHLTLDQLTEAWVHEVDPTFIAALQALGYHPSLDELIQMQIFDVSLNFIHEITAAGYGGVPLGRLIELRLFGIDQAFIESLMQTGGRPSVDELIQFKITGLEARAAA